MSIMNGLLHHRLLKSFRFFKYKSSICKKKNAFFSSSSQQDLLMDVEEKNIAIVGGQGNMGIAVAEELLKNDVRKIALLDNSYNPLVMDDLNCGHEKKIVEFFPADVQNANKLDGALAMAKKEVGNFDVVLNLAGIWFPVQWDEEINTNLIGTVNVNMMAPKYMNKNGIIINTAGLQGIEPMIASPTLSASMAGCVAASRSFGAICNYNRYHIRVACFCPDLTCTAFLKSAGEKQLTPNMKRKVTKQLKNSEILDVAKCARSLLHMIRHAKTGTVWTLTGTTLYHVNFPSWKSSSKLVSQYY